MRVVRSYGGYVASLEQSTAAGRPGEADLLLRVPVGRVEDALMRLADDEDVDIAFQHDNVWRRHRRLVAFDMDSTLIRTEVIDELAKLAGVGDQVSTAAEAVFIAVFADAETD